MHYLNNYSHMTRDALRFEPFIGRVYWNFAFAHYLRRPDSTRDTMAKVEKDQRLPWTDLLLRSD